MRKISEWGRGTVTYDQLMEDNTRKLLNRVERGGRTTNVKGSLNDMPSPHFRPEILPPFRFLVELALRYLTYLCP